MKKLDSATIAARRRKRIVQRYRRGVTKLMEEIGQEFQISRERVRQILAQARIAGGPTPRKP